MSAAPRPRRNLATLPALTPQSSAAPAPTGYKGTAPSDAAELKFVKVILASERRRHAAVEKALAAHITTLNQQVQDLREVYISTINFPIEGTK